MMYRKQLTIALGALMSAGMLMAQAGSASQAVGPGTAQAQDGTQLQAAQGATQANAGHRHRRQMDPDKMADRLGKKLNLNADQVAQLKPILADSKQQMEAPRSDSSLSREDRRAKMQAIHQDSKSKIEAVLNDQQKQQFEAMMQQRRARWENREKPQAQ